MGKKNEGASATVSVVDRTFQKKRHEGDLWRFHPLEGFSVGFVVQRRVLPFKKTPPVRHKHQSSAVKADFHCSAFESHRDELQF